MAESGTQQYADGVRPIHLAIQPGAGQADTARMTIGELAAATGVTLRALRFYQSKGLLAPSRNGRARVFSLADRNRLDLILQGKRLGFTLGEIREILADRDRENSPTLPINRKRCVEQIKFLERQRQDLEQAICELRQIYSCLFRDLLAADHGAARNTL
jgi:DNA-binding transcriptional MerR regulator